MVTAVARFAELAPKYDAARPQAPGELAEALMQWAGRSEPDVVDVGAGTGLSTVIWVGRARQVTAVEPGEEMRAVALRRLGLNPDWPAGSWPPAPRPPAPRPPALRHLASRRPVLPPGRASAGRPGRPRSPSWPAAPRRPGCPTSAPTS